MSLAESPVLAVILLVCGSSRFNCALCNASKKKRNPDLRRPEVRSLKIHPRFRESFNAKVDVPEIRLCGHWLDQFGFCKGRRVTVTTMNELLIITLQPESELEGQR